MHYMLLIYENEAEKQPPEARQQIFAESSSRSSSSSSGGGACAHADCSTGTKLASGCDACVTQVCAADSCCCCTQWDSQCVGEVGSICGDSCGSGSSSSSSSSSSSGSGGGSSAHSDCSTGAKLASGCNSCVSSVCSHDGYCCSTKWDSVCVKEVTTYRSGVSSN